MAAFKNEKNGTWYVQFRYTDWKGERQQKFKRGFATKREAQGWEREFLMQKQDDVTMSFESFAELYEKDIKPRLKENTWLTKESIIKKKSFRILQSAGCAILRQRMLSNGRMKSENLPIKAAENIRKLI